MPGSDVSNGRGGHSPYALSRDSAVDHTDKNEKTVTRAGTMLCLVAEFLMFLDQCEDGAFQGHCAVYLATPEMG